jgi:hypothetical protein
MPLAEKVLNDVDKIAFAREFHVDKWVVPAYTRLCQRKETLTNEEATKIGLDGVLLIYRIREDKYTACRSSCCKSPTMLYCNHCGSRKSIDSVFISDEDVEKKIARWLKKSSSEEQDI